MSPGGGTAPGEGGYHAQHDPQEYRGDPKSNRRHPQASRGNALGRAQGALAEGRVGAPAPTCADVLLGFVCPITATAKTLFRQEPIIAVSSMVETSLCPVLSEANNISRAFARQLHISHRIGWQPKMIGRAEADGIGVAQRAVKRRTSGDAREHADLERESVPGCDLGERRYHLRNIFGCACWSEAAECRGPRVFDHSSRFFWTKCWKRLAPVCLVGMRRFETITAQC